MGRLDSITLCLCLLLLLVFTGTKGQQSQCEDRWFGDKCQYQCHCLNNAVCDKTTGECPGVCDIRWFGPQCQYRDAAYNWWVRLTDGNESTCLVGDELTQTFIMLDNVMFTWMRIVTKRPGLFDRVNKTFLSNNGTEVEPKSPLTKIYVSDTILELYGELQHRFQSIRLDFDLPETRRYFCSMYVSSGRNVALKQSASQSSTDSWDGIVGGPEKAVDGKPQQWWGGDSCTFTRVENSSYWTLNLSLPVTVSMYTILGRSETSVLCRLRYFRLESYNQSNNVQQYDQKEPLDSVSYDVHPLDTSPATYVTLSVSTDFWPDKQFICNNNNAPRMSFCEMQIYGDVVCEPGKWGRDCEKECNCQDPCFVSTGMCPSGCKAGFQGPACQQECIDGRWGLDCLQSCDNCLDGKCNKRTGECQSECLPRYIMPYCVEQCDPRFYGQNCNETCPANCQENIVCDHIDGSCSKCVAGYQGPMCNQECADGQWGISCENNCDKCLSGKCNKVSGECLSGCVQGYKMPFCVQECDLGFHGYNCIFSCPENCRNKTCNKIDGLCIECEAGYQGPLCAQVCDVTFYGQSCSSPCSVMCRDQLCHHITGVCEKCPYGKQISKDCSQDCDAGSHGYNCLQSCPVNCRDNICDNVDGTCTKCVAGYQGLVCKQECDATFYGEDCASQCSGRCIDQLCHHITGVCDNCPDGKQISRDCSQDADTLNLVVILVPLILGLIVVAALIVGICLWRKRKAQKANRQSSFNNESKDGPDVVNGHGGHLELEDNQPPNVPEATIDHYDRISLNVNEGNPDNNETENTSRYVNVENPALNEYERTGENRESHVYTEPDD